MHVSGWSNSPVDRGGDTSENLRMYNRDEVNGKKEKQR